LRQRHPAGCAGPPRTEAYAWEVRKGRPLPDRAGGWAALRDGGAHRGTRAPLAGKNRVCAWAHGPKRAGGCMSVCGLVGALVRNPSSGCIPPPVRINLST